MERTEGVHVPPPPWKCGPKSQQPRRRRHTALRRFLATSATIRRIFAPDFNDADPWGVQWDSLGSFKAIGRGKWEIHQRCAHFLRAQRRQLIYMYSSSIIYIILFHCLNICWERVVLVVG